MSPRLVTWIVLFVMSMGLGIALSEWFFRLYLSVVPPVAVGTFNKDAAHVAFITYGLGAGLLMFVWSLVGMFSARVMKSFSKTAAKI